MAEQGSETSKRALSAALYRIFRSLARLCLRHGVPYDQVSELAKRAFVDVAELEFTIPGRKQSASRVALLTGIHRKDIARMRAAEAPGDAAASTKVAAAARVIAGWRRDRRFLDRRGHSMALPFDGDGPSFIELVRRYGRGDLPARAVLDELQRVGAVTQLKDGRIRLAATGYVPLTTSDESIEIFGSDVSDLVATIDHNIAGAPDSGFFQRKVADDNLPVEALEDIDGRIRREGQALLEKLDRVMARHDRDTNPKVEGSGRKRAMLGVYFFAEDVTEEDE
ncbi:MAG: hypothetical protein E4H03_00195 [Myxococcales bacterium]|nr:MAG: hypothetical protein E4H03_00195 [Myxococcales bacterium]